VGASARVNSAPDGTPGRTNGASDSFKTPRSRVRNVGGMNPKPQLDVIGLVVADMGKALAFYRRLGLEIPASADAEPHVDVLLPSGVRLAWDTIDTIRSFDPHWTSPSGGPRMNLAFHCDSPAAVDAAYADLVNAGYDGHLPPWDAFWGQRYAVLRDPDGNDVALYAPTSGA
jgi:catechol 2,3-dioxygenase-like lactoylglutathione lyase family enzyme